MSFVPRLAVVLALVSVLAGCHRVSFGAVNPTPYAQVPDMAKTYSLEVSSAVANDQPLDTIAIRQFHTTLRNGFQNVAGDRYVAAHTAGACRLVIDSARLGTADLGKVGKYLTLKYRARWIDENDVVVAELVGLAQPRDPTETRPRHLEDLVEVMYEQLVDGLATTEAASRSVAKAQ